MKPTLPRLAALTCLAASLAIPLAMAQSPKAGSPVPPRIPHPPRVEFAALRGEANFRERIALPPGAMLHIALIGRVAGAEYLPLATTATPATNGITPFELLVPLTGLPIGRYRLQAWIIADNRAMFIGRDPQTTIENLSKPAKIQLKLAPPIQNIDGFGDGRPFATATETKPMTLKGTVSKLDRRALHPDSRIEIEVRDVSMADAPSKLVMGQVIQLEGAQLPRDFTLKLAPADLLPRHRYALSARILEVGKLTYLTDTLYPVSPDALDKPFQLKVVPAAPTP